MGELMILNKWCWNNWISVVKRGIYAIPLAHWIQMQSEFARKANGLDMKRWRYWNPFSGVYGQNVEVWGDGSGNEDAEKRRLSGSEAVKQTGRKVVWNSDNRAAMGPFYSRWELNNFKMKGGLAGRRKITDGSRKPSREEEMLSVLKPEGLGMEKATSASE